VAGNMSGCEASSVARTFFVRTDGSDESSGDGDSPSSSFRTWARGIEVISRLNLDQCTVKLRAGREGEPRKFTENIRVSALAFSGRLVVQGDDSGQTTIGSETGDTWTISHAGNVQVRFQQMRLESPKGTAIKIEYQSLVAVGDKVDFGPAAINHLWVHDSQSLLQILAADYSISGDCERHILIQYGHVFFEANRLHLIGNPRFREAFVTAYPRGSFQAIENRLVGEAHGPRFNFRHQSLLNLCGRSDREELPGDMPGFADASSLTI
jgi:hypothetical protein